MNLTVQDIITSSGKYPERAHHPECTPQVLENSKDLCEKVNGLLQEIGVLHAKVSSGFRPSEVNAKTPNAAKRSKHMKGIAVDLEDIVRGIVTKISEHLLEKHGLYMEDPRYTKGWCHLQSMAPRSGKRIFIP